MIVSCWLLISMIRKVTSKGILSYPKATSNRLCIHNTIWSLMKSGFHPLIGSVSSSTQSRQTLNWQRELCALFASQKLSHHSAKQRRSSFARFTTMRGIETRLGWSKRQSRVMQQRHKLLSTNELQWILRLSWQRGIWRLFTKMTAAFLVMTTRS